MAQVDLAGAQRRRIALRSLVPLAGVLAVIALAAVLRLEGLGCDSLWLDETRTRQYALWPPWHPAEALGWQEPPRRVWLVWRLAPDSNTIDYFKRREDYALVERWDLPPYGSFDMPPVILRGPTPIMLFLFERVEPETASAGTARSVSNAIGASPASLHGPGREPTSPDTSVVLAGGSSHAAR